MHDYMKEGQSLKCSREIATDQPPQSEDVLGNNFYGNILCF